MRLADNKDNAVVVDILKNFDYIMVIQKLWILMLW